MKRKNFRNQGTCQISVTSPGKQGHFRADDRRTDGERSDIYLFNIGILPYIKQNSFMNGQNFPILKRFLQF